MILNWFERNGIDVARPFQRLERPPWASLRAGMLRQRIARWLMGNRFVPEIEIEEHEEADLILVDVPGLRREEIEIRVDDETNELLISGERRTRARKHKRLLRIQSERRSGAFSRAVALDRTIDRSSIVAELRDGVLEIELPKSNARVRRIPIGPGAEIRSVDGASKSRRSAVTPS